MQPGDLYLALRGPRFDGNEFLDAAAAAGAVAAVVDRDVTHPTLSLIVVADGQRALSDAARGWRGRFTGPVVGVAGSNGKTTVKEMIASILSQRGECLATRGNLNNQIGVPLTLLRLSAEHRTAVIEIGANRAGEVAELAGIAKPDVGLITNAGAEHLEGFGDLAGVARAEGEMVAGLDASCAAVLNADDEYFPLWNDMTLARRVTFGIREAADYRATGIRESLGDAGFQLSFRLHAPAGERDVQLNVGGRHNVYNALCAAAAAQQAGATLDEVVQGLAGMHPVAGRLRPGPHAAGRNAHRRFLQRESLVDARGHRRAGPAARPRMVRDGRHGRARGFCAVESCGDRRYARDRGVERLFATGPLSTLAVETFGVGATWYPDTDSLARAVDEVLAADVNLLVKGSRSNRLERVVAVLTGAAAAGAHSNGVH